MQISGASGANAQNYCQIAIYFPCPILFYIQSHLFSFLPLPPVAHSLKQVLNLSCYLFICFVLKCKLELWLTKLASVTPSYLTLLTALFEDQQAKERITLLNMGDAIKKFPPSEIGICDSTSSQFNYYSQNCIV